ncbi:hypothetical protein N7540_004837 [Penicillium herquei]|nr:hypothetical protein N7540_004837 [Penicillium herquei]
MAANLNPNRKAIQKALGRVNPVKNKSTDATYFHEVNAGWMCCVSCFNRALNSYEALHAAAEPGAPVNENITFTCSWYNTDASTCKECASPNGTCTAMPAGLQGDWLTYRNILHWVDNMDPATPVANRSTAGADEDDAEVLGGSGGNPNWGPHARKAAFREVLRLSRLLSRIIVNHCKDNGFSSVGKNIVAERAVRTAYQTQCNQQISLNLAILRERNSLDMAAGHEPTYPDDHVIFARLRPSHREYNAWHSAIQSFFMAVAYSAARDIGFTLDLCKAIAATYQRFGNII